MLFFLICQICIFCTSKYMGADAKFTVKVKIISFCFLHHQKREGIERKIDNISPSSNPELKIPNFLMSTSS